MGAHEVGGRGEHRVGFDRRAGDQRLQLRLERRPGPADAGVVVEQAPGERLQLGVAAGLQQRQHMPFLVLVVRGRGLPEVAQYVLRGAARRGVGAVRAQVRAQALEQRQRAAHTLVAGVEQRERRIEAGGRRMQPRQRGCGTGTRALVDHAGLSAKP